jgi:hypothetical protein
LRFFEAADAFPDVLATFETSLGTCNNIGSFVSSTFFSFCSRACSF